MAPCTLKLDFEQSYVKFFNLRVTHSLSSHTLKGFMVATINPSSR